MPANTRGTKVIELPTGTAPNGVLGMPSYRANAIAVGVLFIACTAAAILSIVPLGTLVSAPVDFAWLAANEGQVVATALIELVWVASGMGIAIGLYPALRESSPALALGSVFGRVVENVVILGGTLCLLTLLTVSQQAVAAGSTDAASHLAVGGTLVAARTWATGVVAVIALGVGSLLYNGVFYRSRLVPRWLSGWGLGAAAMSLVPPLYAAFTQDFGFTTVNIAFSVPIAFQEMTLAIWLIAKGFDQSALAATSVRQG